MVKKRNLNRVPIPTNVRVRMHREKKKMRSESQNMLNNQIEEHNVIKYIEPSTLKSELRDWANSYRISKRAVDSLLSTLTSHGIKVIPKNHRTLMKTPVNVQIDEIAGGHFWYNGLENCLRSIFFTLNRDILISLNFNVDGLPLYNSSKITFWPILGSIYGEMIRLTSLKVHMLNKHVFSIPRNAPYSTDGISCMVWHVKTDCLK